MHAERSVLPLFVMPSPLQLLIYSLTAIPASLQARAAAAHLLCYCICNPIQLFHSHCKLVQMSRRAARKKDADSGEEEEEPKPRRSAAAAAAAAAPKKGKAKDADDLPDMHFDMGDIEKELAEAEEEEPPPKRKSRFPTRPPIDSAASSKASSRAGSRVGSRKSSVERAGPKLTRMEDLDRWKWATKYGTEGDQSEERLAQNLEAWEKAGVQLPAADGVDVPGTMMLRKFLWKNKKLCRNGVPPSLRLLVWSVVSGARTMPDRLEHHNRFQFYLDKAPSSLTAKTQKEIASDIPRALNAHPKFNSKTSRDGAEELKRVLSAFATRSPNIGYVNSLSHIAAYFLLYYSDEDAFWILCAIIDIVLPPDYFTQSLLGARADCFPTEDSRILTDQGFLFHEEARAAQELGEAGLAPKLKFACYEPESRGIVYAEGRIVQRENEEGELVAFTQGQEQTRWDAISNGAVPLPSPPPARVDEAVCGGDANFSLRVTRNHVMYTSRNGSHHFERQLAHQALHPRCACAASPHCGCGGASDDDSSLEMLSAATGGAIPSACQTATLHSMLSSALQLHSQQQRDAFLQLYGFWIGQQQLPLTEPSTAALIFRARNALQTDFLQRCFAHVGLQREVDFTEHSSEEAVSASYSLCSPAWCAFFSSLSSPAGQEQLAPWALQLLDRRQTRLLLDAMQLASGDHISACAAGAKSSAESQQLRTFSLPLREQLLVAGLRAGYSPHFERAEDGSWLVTFADASATAASPPSSAAAAAASSSPCRPSLRPSLGEVRVEKHSGSVWCVEVAHPSHLIIAQRAHRDTKSGEVTFASRPVIVGNCQLMKTLVYQRMPKLHAHFAGIGVDVYNVALKWLMVSARCCKK